MLLTIRQTRLNAAALSILLASCGDDVLNQLTPAIDAVPSAVEFSNACVGIDNEAILTVRNLGDGPLVIESLQIEPREHFRVAGIPADRLSPREQTSLTLVFTPSEAERNYEATLTIRSDDPERPVLTVPLRGRASIRDVAAVPASVDFGVVNEGSPLTRAVQIQNNGGTTLRVLGLTWSSTTADLVPVSFPQAAFDLSAKTSTVVRFLYDPKDLGADRGQLRIETNDPDQPILTVPIEGHANLAPTAAAWACPVFFDRVLCPFDERRRNISVGLDGRLRIEGLSSSDPEGGEIIAYDWQIVSRPSESRAALTFSPSDRTRGEATGEFVPDRLGRYEIQLTVRDARGLSSVPGPASTIIVRPRDLDVRLTWNVDTDIDLHFVRPGGSLRDYGNGQPGVSQGSDCSTFNRAPDWGVLGDPFDDPRLDRDDVSGRGPEAVSLDAPETSGPYLVYAHNCDGGGSALSAEVQLEVWVRGVLTATIPMNTGRPLMPSEVRVLAEIQWSGETATVVPRDDPAELRPDLCTSF